MERMLYLGDGILGGIKQFWMAVRVWKMDIVLEELARQKRTKMWPKWGISWGLVEVWQSEWSVVCWIWIARPSTKIWPSDWACGHLDATSRQCSPSHCHLRWTNLWPKKGISVVPQPPYSPDLSPCDFFVYPKKKTQIPPQISSFWNCGQHSKGRDRTAEGISTWRLASTATGSGSNVSGGVWLPKGTTLKGIMLIYK